MTSTTIRPWSCSPLWPAGPGRSRPVQAMTLAGWRPWLLDTLDAEDK
jgi:hypothetical protein